MAVPDEATRKAQTRALFNTIVSEYDQAGPGCFAHFGRRLIDAAGVAPGHAVLDIATGRGAVLFPAAERVGSTGHVIGIDLTDGMIDATNTEAARRGDRRTSPGNGRRGAPVPGAPALTGCCAASRDVLPEPDTGPERDASYSQARRSLSNVHLACQSGRGSQGCARSGWARSPRAAGLDYKRKR